MKENILTKLKSSLPRFQADMVLHTEGWSNQRILKKIDELYSSAITKNNPEAQFLMGALFAKERLFKEAKKLLRKAIKQGHVKARENLKEVLKVERGEYVYGGE